MPLILCDIFRYLLQIETSKEPEEIYSDAEKQIRKLEIMMMTMAMMGRMIENVIVYGKKEKKMKMMMMIMMMIIIMEMMKIMKKMMMTMMTIIVAKKVEKMKVPMVMMEEMMTMTMAVM